MLLSCTLYWFLLLIISYLLLFTFQSTLTVVLFYDAWHGREDSYPHWTDVETKALKAQFLP